MAKLKVSELTRTSFVEDEDLVYVVQGINSRAVTVANLFNRYRDEFATIAASLIIPGDDGPSGPAGPSGPSGPVGPSGFSGVIFNISNVSNTAYLFSGTVFEANGEQNPQLYLSKGLRYNFVNNSEYPIEIKDSANGNVYVSGVSNSANGFVFTVFMNAPSTLYYQANGYPQMGNVIYIS